jgi:hypothetical protein
MGSKRRRRQPKAPHAKRRSNEVDKRGEAPNERRSLRKAYEQLRKRLSGHTRLLWVLVILVAGLVLASWKIGFNPNSQLWKLAGGIPGASRLSWSAVLANVATAPESQLGPVLVEAHRILVLARDRRIKLDEALVLDAGKRALSAAHRGSDLEYLAWQTASAAISYASALQVSFAVPAAVPDCFRTKPQWVLAQAINDTQTTIAVKPIFSSCRLDLDLARGEKPRTYEHGFSCTGCLVTYGGEELAVTTPSFTFQRSVFSFSIRSEPPADGRKLTETLLASKFTMAET